jgi:hypothetical protein
LLAANTLPSHAAVEGDLLVIPSAARPTPVARRVASKQAASGRTGLHPSSHAASAAVHHAPPAHPVAARPRAGAAPAVKKAASPAATSHKPAPKPDTLLAHSAAK